MTDEVSTGEGSFETLPTYKTLEMSCKGGWGKCSRNVTCDDEINLNIFTIQMYIVSRI